VSDIWDANKHNTNGSAMLPFCFLATLQPQKSKVWFPISNIIIITNSVTQHITSLRNLQRRVVFILSRKRQHRFSVFPYTKDFPPLFREEGEEEEIRDKSFCENDSDKVVVVTNPILLQKSIPTQHQRNQ